MDEEEEEALLAVVASGAALGADAAKVFASEDVDEELDVESSPYVRRGRGRPQGLPVLRRKNDPNAYGGYSDFPPL